MEDKAFIERLLAVQTALKAPKGQFNKFGGYSYRSCEDILEAVKPLLVENGLLLTVWDTAVEVGGWHYIKAVASVSDGTSSADGIGYARESEAKKGMDASQITGTASSYARKYALGGLFLIDDTKDDDTRRPSDDKPASADIKQRIANGKRRLASVSPWTDETMQPVLAPLTYEQQLEWLTSEYRSAKEQMQ